MALVRDINSLTDMKEYVLRKLGAPVIDIEVSEDQLEQCIFDAIQKFTEFAMEGQLEKSLLLDLQPGVFEYKLDSKISSVIEVVTSSKGSLMSGFQIHGEVLTKSEFFASPISPVTGAMDMTSMYAMLARFSSIEMMFSITPNFNFSSATGIISFTEDLYKINKQVLLHCFSKYNLNEDDDRIFNHQWIKNYAVALTKQSWMSALGKYDSPLINGAKINYDRMLQEAATEIEKLDTQLLTTWTEPFGIYRG